MVTDGFSSSFEERPVLSPWVGIGRVLDNAIFAYSRRRDSTCDPESVKSTRLLAVSRTG